MVKYFATKSTLTLRTVMRFRFSIIGVFLPTTPTTGDLQKDDDLPNKKEKIIFFVGNNYRLLPVTPHKTK